MSESQKSMLSSLFGTATPEEVYRLRGLLQFLVDHHKSNPTTQHADIYVTSEECAIYETWVGRLESLGLKNPFSGVIVNGVRM